MPQAASEFSDIIVKCIRCWSLKGVSKSLLAPEIGPVRPVACADV